MGQRSCEASTVYFSDPSDVLPSIFLAKPQIFVQAEAHIVPIEAVGGKP